MCTAHVFQMSPHQDCKSPNFILCPVFINHCSWQIFCFCYKKTFTFSTAHFTNFNCPCHRFDVPVRMSIGTKEFGCYGKQQLEA